MFRFVLVMLILSLLSLRSVDARSKSNKKKSSDSSSSLKGWSNKYCIVLPKTERKPARTAILIIAPPTLGNYFVENRWALGQKVWEQYMHSHPNVDCFFLISACPRKDSSEQVWLEGNTICVGDSWQEEYGNDRLLHKTMKALEWLEGKYTHFIRTNINTFFNLHAVNDYMEMHHVSMYTTPIWQGAWYTIGYAVVFSADVAAHMVREYNRLDAAGEELVSCYHADDAALTSLATGVWPYNDNHPFRCCPTLPFGVRQLMCRQSLTTKRFGQYGALLTPVSGLEELLSYCEQASSETILYRTADDLVHKLDELAQYYEYMLNKIYPELGPVDLVTYVEFLKNREKKRYEFKSY